jgi:hypothetical protein
VRQGAELAGNAASRVSAVGSFSEVGLRSLRSSRHRPHRVMLMRDVRCVTIPRATAPQSARLPAMVVRVTRVHHGQPDVETLTRLQTADFARANDAWAIKCAGFRQPGSIARAALLAFLQPDEDAITPARPQPVRGPAGRKVS